MVSLCNEISLLLCIFIVVFTGIFIILAWPILAYWSGSSYKTSLTQWWMSLTQWWMVQIHHILVLTSLFFTCPAFLLIFVAFCNNSTRGLSVLIWRQNCQPSRYKCLLGVCRSHVRIWPSGWCDEHVFWLLPVLLSRGDTTKEEGRSV